MRAPSRPLAMNSLRAATRMRISASPVSILRGWVSVFPDSAGFFLAVAWVFGFLPRGKLFGLTICLNIVRGYGPAQGGNRRGIGNRIEKEYFSMDMAQSPSHPNPVSDVPLYMADRFAPVRRNTLKVRVGNRHIGGDSPILIQSMTTTNTKDIDATVFQTLELARAGCELVRITAPTQKDAEYLKEIMAKVRSAGCDVPVSADIHFQPRAAMEAAKWVEKVRINPGNF